METKTELWNVPPAWHPPAQVCKNAALLAWEFSYGGLWLSITDTLCVGPQGWPWLTFAFLKDRFVLVLRFFLGASGSFLDAFWVSLDALCLLEVSWGSLW